MFKSATIYNIEQKDEATVMAIGLSRSGSYRSDRLLDNPGQSVYGLEARPSLAGYMVPQCSLGREYS